MAAFAGIDAKDIVKVGVAYQDGSAEDTSKGIDAVLYHAKGQNGIGVLMFDNQKQKFTTKIDKVDNYLRNWRAVNVYPAYPTRKGVRAMSPDERKSLVM